MSVVLRTAQDVARRVGALIEHTINHLLPPKQREQVLENLRAFSVRNPKLASFLAAQAALAGLPILLFFTFAIATLIVSLITCIFLGIIAALMLTLLTTGFVLLFVVPAVFIGSCTASIAFLWGLLGYLILQRLNGGETAVQPETRVGDTLNGLTGGRTRDLADRADPDPQQERMVVDQSRDEELSMGRKSGRGDNRTCSSSPRRRAHGQTNGSGHYGEAEEERQEGGTRSAHKRAQDIMQGAQLHPETRLATYNPTIDGVGDWKAEFQQGIKA
ncbi:hypothetical protein OPT61_g4096 [Boeremia exigua]|uniref:Uncharacterized protein n=1 Tax=Boeremia exigua TaxID=749465 RepID=A0ACC2IFB3_9PLEO|nr:hypothetical protein OPT61_g4096 [Boeremia exigua]